MSAVPLPPQQTVLGYPVDLGTKAELLARLHTQLDTPDTAPPTVHVVTLNPEMIMRGQQDPAFGTVLKQADLVLPDGAGVVWALNRRLKGKQPQARVAGIEFSEALLAHAAEHREPVALIGAADDINRAAVANLIERFRGLQVVYHHHGFLQTDAQRRAVAEACAMAQPRYVFVAMGVPHQEYWIRDYRHLFSQPTALIGVGGSFDIWSGLKQRAHPLFLKLGLEWLWRITAEPWRLKRVYKTLPMFVVQVLVSKDCT
ncbi:MAG: WecB/TagA/CpsF family glycosyltransferase [Cyanobacteria bacterium HKST-UBA04]|nr:WecB/TagA/CpsF family glycosyltransferase [Cyanobacteria bacterium HKST-UBA04]